MYNKLTGGILLLALLMLGFPLPAPAADTPPTVVINELMWMGSSASSADEWIELRNTTDAPVDLSGWQLTRRSSGVETVMLTIPNGKSIPAGGVFLIANNAPTALFGTAPNQKESPLSVMPDLVDASVSLLNSGLQIKLYAGVWDSGGALIDVADDGSGDPLSDGFDSTKGVYASMERNRAPGDGTAASSWHIASAATGWDANAIELGTPASENSATVPTAVLSGPDTAVVGQTVTFDGSESIDLEDRELTFAWKFGDGQEASGPTPTHTFTAEGSFTVVLTVSNGQSSGNASQVVTVSAAPMDIPTPVEPETAPPVTPEPVNLELSEVQMAPSASEFIEVHNFGSTRAILSGWKLADATHPYSIPEGTTLDPGSFRSFSVAKTGLHLNDDGDTVTLLDPSDVVRNGVRYSKTRADWSLIKTSDGWMWTNNPTPGSANKALEVIEPAAVLEAPDPPAAQVTESAVQGAKSVSTKSVALVPSLVSLDTVSELAKGTTTRVRGTVSAAPGAVAARTFFIGSTDQGLTVYSATAPLPKLNLGDRVEVIGRVSHVVKGDRLLLSKTVDVKVLGSGAAPTPRSVTAAELDADSRSVLVTVSGSVTDVTSSKITLDDGTGEVSVRRSKGLSVKVGDPLTVVGVVVGTESGVALYPRGLDDLQKNGVVAGEESSNSPVPTVQTAKAATPKTALSIESPNGDSGARSLLYFGGSLLLGAAVIGLLKRFAPHLMDRKSK
jgi:PKD repeat protein